jgi:hypothetical protein
MRGVASPSRASSKGERSRDVTTIATDNDRLRELEADTRRAWGEYSERLRDLTGDDYEHAEHDSWELLQRELRGLERQRASLVADSD